MCCRHRVDPDISGREFPRRPGHALYSILMPSGDFWSDRRVYVTGHTGFKGGWMVAWLKALGARVSGYSLRPSTTPSFFEVCSLADRVQNTYGDIRDLESVRRDVLACEPEIIFHMAAQPLVLRSHEQPVETFATNILGTVNVLEAVRSVSSVRAVVVITTDKCYQNRGWVWGYREDEPLGGRDPYSASKACAELATAAYRHSFFENGNVGIATARAGNVIGGGDWADDRIVPDAIRTLDRGEVLRVRKPRAVRPWQHVLEPIAGYFALAERLFADPRSFGGGWNFGPADIDCVPVSVLADLLTASWGGEASWVSVEQQNAPHEESFLKLDSSKAHHHLAWEPRLSVSEAVGWSVQWYKKALEPRGQTDLYSFTREQIERYDALPGRSHFTNSVTPKVS
jgi:CDP-glucose 4,6-dehydratase